MQKSQDYYKLQVGLEIALFFKFDVISQIKILLQCAIFDMDSLFFSF